NRCFALVARGEYRPALDLMTQTHALAAERGIPFIMARVGNTRGWLYQEFGDFTRAIELDREAAEVGKRIKNGNVEIGSLINVGFDHLNLGAPERALPLIEETIARAGKSFGLHRWRWSIHLAFTAATTLMELGRDADALREADRGLGEAVATRSRKYVGWFHYVRGELALRAGQAVAAADELERALAITQAIGYPTLAWQAAHRLADAQAASG